jgi:hypothetical protein
VANQAIFTGAVRCANREKRPLHGPRARLRPALGGTAARQTGDCTETVSSWQRKQTACMKSAPRITASPVATAPKVLQVTGLEVW